MEEPKSFVGIYFENKTGGSLRSTITPDWSDKNTQHHLDMVGCPKDAKAVCEIGCGIGRLLKEIYDSGVGHCVGLDASASMIKAGQEYVGDRNIQLLKVNGNGSVDFGLNKYFDFVFSIITFQHIPNTDAVKKYLEVSYHLLRYGGELMFQVLSEDYNRGELWTYHPISDLENHLLELGFIEVEIKRYDRWTVFRAKKNGKD